MYNNKKENFLFHAEGYNYESFDLLSSKHVGHE